MKINQLLPQEEKFTEVLTHIALVPKILFYYGKIPQNRFLLADNLAVSEKQPSITSPPSDHPREISTERPKSVAIVGARRHTDYGASVAYRLAYDIAQHGVVVVSGLAVGIDSIAHRGALAAGGCTVAVLGTSIDKIYPQRHTRLAEKIVEQGGCILSEYGRGTPTFRTSFLERNRLIAGLADAVIIVEATDHSGSLNTATHALDQGRDLFVVPGDITRPTSVGCNRLIMQGAMPCTCAEDVLNVLFPTRSERKARQLPLFGDNTDETTILKLLKNGLRDGEELVVQAQMSVSTFNQTIAMLEIKGRVQRLGGNKWALC